MSLRSHGWIVAVAIVVGAAGTRTGSALQAESREAERAPVLNLRLTVWSEFPALSRQALVAEASSIWRDGNIQLRWLTGNPPPQTGTTLRVLVTPRAVVSSVEGHTWTVGELLRFGETSAIAVASITGAQRILDESQRVGLLDLPATYEHRLGVVLGRAVAHEIGHYVLQTNTHASHGLMRATIDAREFADLRTGTFRLDGEARAHLADRAARGDRAAAEFSYSLQ
jgi:hypothetical protein